MTLSTYPLYPLERDWTEHQALPAADRVFSGDTAEGTYIALRLLLHDQSLDRRTAAEEKLPEPGCRVIDNPTTVTFVPPISCQEGLPPIPDYSPPFWTLPRQCGEAAEGNPQGIANQGDSCPYQGPATWLSVLNANRFWPMASLLHETPDAPAADTSSFDRDVKRETDPGGLPRIPLEMKVLLLGLLGFSVFHAWCCCSGSYAAKPVFLAHFASTKDLRHTTLVFAGSCCVAFCAIVAGWGCGLFSLPAPGLAYPRAALVCLALTWLLALGAILANLRRSWQLSQDVNEATQDSPVVPRMSDKDLVTWSLRASGSFLLASLVYCLLVVFLIDWKLLPENQVLTYWRAMHLTSGVSPIVPLLSILFGIYLSFWYTLHGLALFGPDRPCLPPKDRLTVSGGKGSRKGFLRMFSQEEAADKIEQEAKPLNWKVLETTAGLCLLFAAIGCGLGGRMPVRSLGAWTYSAVFLVGLDLCCSLSIVEAWRLYRVWDELRRLLAFLDRLPLRRTLAALHGFSWGSVWKMSGNVLEVRYKVISRQMECMNHTVASLGEHLADVAAKGKSDRGAQKALAALSDIRLAGADFAKWYSGNYNNGSVGDLSSFHRFQQRVAAATGTLLSELLVPSWRLEPGSLLVLPAAKDEKDPKDEKDGPPSSLPFLAKEQHIRNAEEFVALNYLAFIQNVLGRLRTMAMTIAVLFIASACAMSSYPFDPRQTLSAVLVLLFLVGSVVIVKVYADMHRDATLSHVTNTKPGELGTEFWFKIIGFGFAPLLGLATRIFPGIADFLLSWVQPGMASLK